MDNFEETGFLRHIRTEIEMSSRKLGSIHRIYTISSLTKLEHIRGGVVTNSTPAKLYANSSWPREEKYDLLTT